MRGKLCLGGALALASALGAPVGAAPDPVGVLASAASETALATPGAVGELIYRGETFALGAPAQGPLFRYERRVAQDPAGWVARHTTHDRSGRWVVTEAARVSPRYELRRFEVAHPQAGFSGTAVLSGDGRRIDYLLHSGGKTSRASEQVSEPVLVGPSMFGFLLQHWDELRSGAVLPVRLLVLKDKTSYGFALRFDQQIGQQMWFSVTPRNWLVRLAVAPLRVALDADTRQVLRYEGRVPPLLEVDGALQALDARVEYTAVAAHYR